MTDHVLDIAFLKPPPMAYEDVSLHLEQTIPADQEKGFVPIYRFAIHTAENIRVGHISFKVGDVEAITGYLGHIGFEILPEFRGRRFAMKACQAIRPFVGRYYSVVIITANNDNAASIRTIELLGATYIGEVLVRKMPGIKEDQIGLHKRRYAWEIQDN